MVKNPPVSAGDTREMGSTPGSGRSPEGGYGNSLQYPLLENPMDRGTWEDHGLQKVAHDSATEHTHTDKDSYKPIRRKVTKMSKKFSTDSLAKNGNKANKRRTMPHNKCKDAQHHEELRYRQIKFTRYHCISIE